MIRIFEQPAIAVVVLMSSVCLGSGVTVGEGSVLLNDTAVTVKKAQYVRRHASVFIHVLAVARVGEAEDDHYGVDLYLKCHEAVQGECRDVEGVVSAFAGLNDQYRGTLASSSLSLTPHLLGSKLSGAMVASVAYSDDDPLELQIRFRDLAIAKDAGAMDEIGHPALQRQFPALRPWADELGVRIVPESEWKAEVDRLRELLEAEDKRLREEMD